MYCVVNDVLPNALENVEAYTEIDSEIVSVALSLDLNKKLEEKPYPSYIENEDAPFQIHLGHCKVDCKL